MSQEILSSSQRASRGELGPRLRYLGIALTGGKSELTTLAWLESYPEQDRLLLRLDTVKSESSISGDALIIEAIQKNSLDLRSVGFDAPLTLPLCMRCELPCPGYEKCELEEIEWMRSRHFSVRPHPKTRTFFTPYTQRCVDYFFAEKKQEMQHALGSNMAPLTARAHFLKRRIDKPMFEVFPKIAVAKLAESLSLSKLAIQSYRNSVGGKEAREKLLKAFVKKMNLFIYQQDLKQMLAHPTPFEAFVVSWCLWCQDLGLIEPRPEGFPENEQWILVPKLSNTP